MRYVVTTAALMLLLAGPAAGDAARASTAVQKSVAVTVVWVETQRELSELREEQHNLLGFAHLADKRLQAFTLTMDDGSCRIYAVRPRRVNDDATLMLGHEMVHCLIGNYH